MIYYYYYYYYYYYDYWDPKNSCRKNCCSGWRSYFFL